MHIGMHKTGSSSIQKSLYNSRDVLLKAGYYYPEKIWWNHSPAIFSPFTSWPETYHVNIRDNRISRKSIIKYNKELVQLWKKEIKESAGRNFIISAEDLSVLDYDGVVKLKKFMNRYFKKIKIICYVRDPESFRRSAEQERIKHGEFSRADDPILPDYRFRVEKYIKIFGEENVVVKRFGRDYFYCNDLIDDFIRMLDMEIDSSLIVKETTNESLGRYATFILNKLNERYPSIVGGKLNPLRGDIPPIFIPDIYNRIDDIYKHEGFNYDEKTAEILNEDINYINQYLINNEKFERIIPHNVMGLKDELQNIPIDYFVDLINEYNKIVSKYLELIGGK